MAANFRLYPNLYKDSVSLMAVTARVTELPGIDAGSVVRTWPRPAWAISRSGPTTSSSR